MDQETRQMILNIKWAHDVGATYRSIADMLGISKSKAQRLCKQWTPQLEQAETGKWPAGVSEFYFPGREEYVAAGRAEGPEGYLAQLACANARQEYLKTGKAPPLAEMLARMSAADRLSEPGAAVAGVPRNTGTLSVPEPTGFPDADPQELPALFRRGGSEADGVVVQSDDGGAVDDLSEPLITHHPSLVTSGRKAGLDPYGNVMIIEREDERGKPVVWVIIDKKGVKRRKVRTMNVIMSTVVD